MTVRFFAGLLLFSVFLLRFYICASCVLFVLFFVCIIFYRFYLSLLKAHWRPRLCKWQCVVVSRTMWSTRSQKFIHTC